jgi:hypothetical protein
MNGDPVGRALAWIGTRARPAIFACGLIMLAAYLVAILAFPKPDGRVLFGDATHHFVQLRSAVFDHDLDFQNEYVRIYRLRGGEPGTEWVFTELTPTGRVRNYMPVGPAILWSPLYLAAVVVVSLISSGGTGPDGFETILQLMPGVTGVIAATFGAWFAWGAARRLTDADSAAAAVFGVWIGSHALYYSMVSPTYSHSASMFASAAFFAYWLYSRHQPSIRHAAVWGALVGVAALMRWQDVVLAAIPIIEILRWRTAWSKRLSALLTMGAASLAAFSPQMVVWYALYGTALALPQGPSFVQWQQPHLIDVLLSDNHGLYTWAPILVLASIGLVTCLMRHRALALPIAVVVLLSWYVNASVADWWAGEAFGARRFLSLFPLFVLGLATWVHGASTAAARTRRVAVLSVLAAANLLLLLQYQCFMKGLTTVAPYPHGWFDMWVVRFVVPFRLFGW